MSARCQPSMSLENIILSHDFSRVAFSYGGWQLCFTWGLFHRIILNQRTLFFKRKVLDSVDESL